MAFFAIAVACEAVAAAAGWNEALYRTWYLTGAVWTAGWLGLGTAFLLGRTRFGFGFALCLFLAGLFTFLTARRNPDIYAEAWTAADALLPGRRRPGPGRRRSRPTSRTGAGPGWLSSRSVERPSSSVVLMVLAALPAPGYALDAATGVPTAAILPPELRLLTPFMNVTGAFALILGALFSAYVFMPKRRVLLVFARSGPAR